MGIRYDDLVRRTGFFQGLPESTLGRICEGYSVRSADEGAFFFREQDPAASLYLLAQGKVKIGQLSEDGQQVTMRFIVSGELFGGVAVLGSGVTYPVSAEAMKPSVAVSWTGQYLRELARRDPGLGLTMTELMYAHLQEMQMRFRELATERVERRVARALLRLANQAGRRLKEGLLIDLPLSRQEIAEMTGTTLFTVSRLLSDWERKGVIEAGRERVVIRDPPGLVMIAEDVDKK